MDVIRAGRNRSCSTRKRRGVTSDEWKKPIAQLVASGVHCNYRWTLKPRAELVHRKDSDIVAADKQRGVESWERQRRASSQARHLTKDKMGERTETQRERGKNISQKEIHHTKAVKVRKRETLAGT